MTGCGRLYGFHRGERFYALRWDPSTRSTRERRNTPEEERAQTGSARCRGCALALDGVALSDAERASRDDLAGGFEAHAVENIADVITRARQTR